MGADVAGSHAAAPPEGDKKGKKERRKKESRQKRRAAKELEEYGHLDQSWKSFRTPDDSNRARHSGRYSLAPAGGRDEGSMLVEPELMRRWEAKRVPSKTPEAARGSADPLNLQSDRKIFARRRALSDWLHVEKLPQGAEIETLIDDPETGTRLATISQFTRRPSARGCGSSWIRSTSCRASACPWIRSPSGPTAMRTSGGARTPWWRRWRTAWRR